jgi:ribose transport system permease protein
MDTFAVGVPFVVVLILSIVFVPNFLSPADISNILGNASFVAIIGYGMTFVIATRGIDLSVGSGQAIVASITAISVNMFGVLPGILVGIVTGLVLGLVNGVVITQFRVPAFVATLAAMSAFRGLALLVTNGQSIDIQDKTFDALVGTSVHGVELQMVVAVVLGVIAWFVLTGTPFGKHVIAVGGRPEAAAEVGIRINRVLILVYLISGLTVAIASVLQASQLAVVNPSMAAGLELEVIAVVVLGGTSLAGGRGNILGTAIASVLLAMINSSLNLLNVPAYWQYVAIGVLLLLALSVDGLQRIRVRRLRILIGQEIAA